MNTILLDGADDRQLKKAAELLHNGKLVAIPTETVYGLAADAFNDDAVAAIFAAKGRPADHPLIVHIGRIEQLNQLARDIPPPAVELAKYFWPGPLTLLLNKSQHVPDVVTGGLATVGVRMPKHDVTQALLAENDLMVAAPSANPYKRLSPTSAEQVLHGLNGKIDAVLDGGMCHIGLESTIVDLTAFNETGDISIRRSGHITAEQISQVIGLPVNAWQPHELKVAGNVSAHYQPGPPLYLKSTNEIATKLRTLHDNIPGVVSYSDELSPILKALPPTRWIALPKDKAGFARALYAALYQLDRQCVPEIWLETPPDTLQWQDVNDRLSRAATEAGT
ncbi:L-threonylcarbamoyladenylate synthase [Aestuariibacter salexigens]|uniref:L-threonylcarbamoyladenylate synthase n=1 Tax=Aestuariibacter salexigens TaxID=226010 RepID=UPI0006841310|nr:L-threonylcarbamoyladenylate synthase [Aestuariibacter salexigens]